MRRFLIAALGFAGTLVFAAMASAQTDLDRFKAQGAAVLSAADLKAMHSDTTFTGTFLPLFGEEANVPFEAYNAADGERVFAFQGRTQLIKWWMKDGKFCQTGYSTRSIPCDWSFYRLGTETRMYHPDGKMHAAFNVTPGDPGGLKP